MRKHVYNMKTCLFQYKTIGSEHMFEIQLFDITIYLVGAHELLPTIGTVCLLPYIGWNRCMWVVIKAYRSI